MTPQVDFFCSLVKCVDGVISEPDLSGKIKSSMVNDREFGGAITIAVRDKPFVWVNFMSQPFIHLGGAAAEPLQILSADSAISLRDDTRRKLSPEDLAQSILSFIRKELKRVDLRS